MGIFYQLVSGEWYKCRKKLKGLDAVVFGSYPQDISSLQICFITKRAED